MTVIPSGRSPRGQERTCSVCTPPTTHRAAHLPQTDQDSKIIWISPTAPPRELCHPKATEKHLLNSRFSPEPPVLVFNLPHTQSSPAQEVFEVSKPLHPCSNIPSSLCACRRGLSTDREGGWRCFASFASFPCACCCCLSRSDGWLLVLAPSHREICHLMPGRGDSKSISTETALTGRLLSRPLGAGIFFASHLSASSPPLFCTGLSKSSFEQTHLAQCGLHTQAGTVLN